MAQDGQLTKSVLTKILDLPPSCIEFCPAHPDHFVVGTYDLQKEASTSEATINQDATPVGQQQQTRHGSLLLFQLRGNMIEHVQTLAQPAALLDAHFHPTKTNILAVANSVGMVSILKLEVSTGGAQLRLSEIVAHRPMGDVDNDLILSCNWHDDIPDILALTTSSNQVHVIQLDESWNIRSGQTLIHSHEDQAWTAVFAPGTWMSPSNHNTFEIFSGGDDFKLLRSTCEYHGENSWFVSGATKTIGRHEYGVTAILPLHTDEESQEAILLTGSYDDHIRVYVVGSTPRLLAKMDLGGGVWRLKLISLDVGDHELGDWTATVLASCMYAGTRIVRVSGNWYQCTIKVLVRFEEHESMNYGSDFHVGKDGKSVQVVSTSFYDKRLCLWEYSPVQGLSQHQSGS